jgi:hypothetical protein
VAQDGAAAVYLAEAARESMTTGRVIDMITFDPRHAQTGADA